MTIRTKNDHPKELSGLSAPHGSIDGCKQQEPSILMRKTLNNRDFNWLSCILWMHSHDFR